MLRVTTAPPRLSNYAGDPEENQPKDYIVFRHAYRVRFSFLDGQPSQEHEQRTKSISHLVLFAVHNNAPKSFRRSSALLCHKKS